MSRPSNDERLQTVHAEALAEFDRVQEAMYEVRLECLRDRRFYSIAGAQWEGPLGDQFANKPRLEFNKTHLAVIRIINEYRNNRVTVNFTPKDGATNRDLADTCDGLYRADERDSGAQEAYDNAFEEGVGGGFGAARLCAKYEDEDDDDNDKQRVRILPIFDADSSVFFDLDAKRMDKADAVKCWVLVSMTHSAFFDQFGHSPSSWAKTITQTWFDWYTPDIVYVAHYYVVEMKTELVHIYRGLDGQDMSVPDAELKEDENKEAELLATGFREVRQKRIKVRKVHKYIMSGNGIEEDEGYIAGKCIPVVPYYGKRWFVDNIERCQGHVRLAKDAQRLTNSLLSWLTELAAKFDAEKPIFTPEQVLGHATRWANDNVERFPYLLINPTVDANGNKVNAGPVAYTRAPNVPPAMAALIQIADVALSDLLGKQEQGEQLQPAVSGRAVELIQTRLDMQTFIYMSNFKTFMQRVGEVWLSISRDIIVQEARTMKTIGPDGEVSSVDVNLPSYDEKTGAETVENDITEAHFDVWADVGPSSTSRRAATVKALTGMAAVSDDPEAKQVLQAAAIMNMEGEGLGEVQAFFRSKLVRLGVVKPTDQELEEMQQEQADAKPDAQAQYLAAAAEEAAGAAALNRAKTVSTIADADLKRAQTEKTEAETSGAHQTNRIAGLQALQGFLAPGATTGLPD